MYIGTICQAIFDSTKEIAERTNDDLQAAVQATYQISAQIENITKSKFENLKELESRLSESLFFKLENLVSQYRFGDESAQDIARQVGMDCEVWAKRLCCVGNYLLVGEALDDVYHAIHDNASKWGTVADLIKVDMTLILSWAIGDLLIILFGESLLVLGLVAASYISIHEFLEAIDNHIKKQHNWS